jgi:hypothetical protein
MRPDEYSKSDWISVDPRQVFEWRNGELRLRCPACGFQCTHVERIFALPGDYGEEAHDGEEGHLPHDLRHGVSVRRTCGHNDGSLVIEVSGECEHLFRIHLQQHEGDTDLQVWYRSKPRAFPDENIEPEPTDEHPTDGNDSNVHWI